MAPSSGPASGATRAERQNGSHVCGVSAFEIIGINRRRWVLLSVTVRSGRGGGRVALSDVDGLVKATEGSVEDMNGTVDA